MNKISVFGTISRAYGFLIGEFVTIVRLTWAPLLAAAVVQYYFGGPLLEAGIKVMQTDDQSRMLGLGPTQFLLGLVVIVAQVMALVALLRVITTGDRKPGLFVYAWFGSAEIRLMAVILLLVIAFVAGLVGSMLALVILAGLAAAFPVAGILVLLACVALIIALFWTILRLSLIAPVVVAESGLGVERSWQLMRGNALRMLVVLIVTLVPFGIVANIVSNILFGGDMPAFPDISGLWASSHNDFKAFVEGFEKVLKPYQIGVMQWQLKHWPEICGFSFVTSIISTALNAGMSGSAYMSAAGRNA